MRFWMSWIVKEEDYRPLTFPPNEAILGWWNTGTTSTSASSRCVGHGASVSPKPESFSFSFLLRDGIGLAGEHPRRYTKVTANVLGLKYPGFDESCLGGCGSKGLTNYLQVSVPDFIGHLLCVTHLSNSSTRIDRRVILPSRTPRVTPAKLERVCAYGERPFSTLPLSSFGLDEIPNVSGYLTA